MSTNEEHTHPLFPEHDAYEHVSDTPLPEYRGVGRLFRHVSSGCEVYHLSNDDEENLFAFVFKTVPQDSTGVAHILEHTVLCGSERYPVKDPFLLLLKGSMYTFLNALTFPDKTVYPASSTVDADLFNLMKVYGDAVFFPLLKEEMFRQEGHRLIVNDDGSLQYSGIVYNEMKGAYSTHDAIAGELSIRSIFPDTAYGYDSGGRPEDIPRLTYENFIDFHRRAYHPSNARIFLYGNVPTERYLNFLHDEFLGRFHDSQPTVDVALQSRWDAPRVEYAQYPTENPDTARQASVTVNWLLPESTRAEELIRFSALADILLGGSGSPLYVALIESGLGEDLSAPTGIETELRQIVFSAGLRGTDPERREEIEQIIFSTLVSLRDNGIDPDVIEGTLRKMEFSHRERPGVGYGLRLMRRALRGWLHGDAPESTLAFEAPFAGLREALSAHPRYFESLIDEYLINNPHRSTLVVTPDPELAEKEDARARAELESVKGGMTEADLELLRQANEALERLQREPDEPEAVARVPFLTLSDVPRDIRRIESDAGSVAGGGVSLLHTIETGGIVYYDLAFDLRGVENRLLPLVPFLANAVTDVGLPGMSYDEVARRLDLTTGGFSGGVDVDQPLGSTEPIPYLYIRLKALASTLETGSALAFDCLRSPDFSDERRIRDLFVEARNDLRSNVLPGGSAFARLEAASRLSAAEALSNRFRGIQQLEFMNSVDIQSSMQSFTEDLEALRRQVFTATRLKASVSAEAPDLPLADRILRDFARSIDHVVPQHPDSFAPNTGSAVRGYGVPGDVGYVARVVPGSKLDDDGYAHELVLSHLLKTGFLWERIRMEGGAYGAFAVSSATEGVFSFASYRDPRIVETFQAFEEGLKRYAMEAPSARDVELAVIGIVGKDLRPYSPSETNMIDLRRYLLNITDELRQLKRDSLLRTTPEDIQLAARRLLDRWSESKACVIARAERIEAVRDKIPGLDATIEELTL
ncbi:MAG: insulinase family protein [Spirochaetaceae bacterium]